MIIQCPECGTKYTVRREAIEPKGRTVRCATCGSKWHEAGKGDFSVEATTPREPRAEYVPVEREPELDEDPPEADASFADAPGSELAEPDVSLTAQRPQLVEEAIPVETDVAADAGSKASRTASAMILASSVLLVMAAGAASRPAVESVWPASSRLYQIAGLAAPPAGAGLELHDVRAVLRGSGAERSLVVAGSISGATKDTLTVPTLVATQMIDGKPGRSWTFPPGVASVTGKTPARFSTSLDAADAAGGNLVLTFATEDSHVPAQ